MVSARRTKDPRSPLPLDRPSAVIGNLQAGFALAGPEGQPVGGRRVRPEDTKSRRLHRRTSPGCAMRACKRGLFHAAVHDAQQRNGFRRVRCGLTNRNTKTRGSPPRRKPLDSDLSNLETLCVRHQRDVGVDTPVARQRAVSIRRQAAPQADQAHDDRHETHETIFAEESRRLLNLAPSEGAEPGLGEAATRRSERLLERCRGLLAVDSRPRGRTGCAAARNGRASSAA